VAPIDDPASEEFVTMLRVLIEDEDLKRWFLSLKPMPANLRHSMLGAMIEEMKTNGEDAELIAAIALLIDPAVYDAAFKIIVRQND
jgi:hypothetical protein